MTATTYAQLVGLGAGMLLLSVVLMVWRRSLSASVRLLAVQGAALAAVVAVMGLHEESLELVLVSGLVLGLKAVVLPVVLTRSVVGLTGEREDSTRLNPTAQLLAATGLTMLAFLVSRPVVGDSTDPAVRAVPVGIALVLIGFQLLVTRNRAVSQLVGFLVLDNGIATVAFLTAGGVPLVVELGASLDVLLVVLILQVLNGRMQMAHGVTDLDELTELHD